MALMQNIIDVACMWLFTLKLKTNTINYNENE
jgi:hypothetical protein